LPDRFYLEFFRLSLAAHQYRIRRETRSAAILSRYLCKKDAKNSKIKHKQAARISHCVLNDT
jgi:hypothetical protein